MNIHYDNKVAKKKDSHFQEQISNEYICSGVILTIGIKKDIKMEEAEDN